MKGSNIIMNTNDRIRLNNNLKLQKETVLYELGQFEKLYCLTEDSEFRKIYNDIQNAFDIRIAELDKTIIK